MLRWRAMRRLLVLALAMNACSLPVRVASPSLPVDPVGRAPRLIALAASANEIFFVRNSAGNCELLAAERQTRQTRVVRELDFCPSTIAMAGADTILLKGDETSIWVTADGRDVMTDAAVLAARDREHYLTARGGELHLVSGSDDMPIGAAAGLSQFRLLPDSSAAIAIERTKGGDTLIRISRDGRKALLTTPSTAIESYDIAPDSSEIVFVAGNENRDVAIVSADGGDPRWIGTDPADETTVTWAPRGHKVSWVIHAFGGDVVRTVHVPSAFSLLADSGGAAVTAMAWEPEAERFVYIRSSPATSDEIDESRFGGEEKRVVLPPAASSPISMAAFPEGGAATLLAAPVNPRYGHVYPLVIWTETNPWRWNDARASIAGAGDSGFVLTASEPDEKLWRAVSDLRWADPARITVVSTRELNSLARPKGWSVTVIAPEMSQNETVVRDGDREIRMRVRGTTPDVIESVATRHIVRQMKGPAAADAKH